MEARPRFTSGEQAYTVALRANGLIPRQVTIQARFKVGKKTYHEYTIRHNEPAAGPLVRLQDNEYCVPWRRIYKTRSEAEGAIKDYLLQHSARPVLVKPKYSIGDLFGRPGIRSENPEMWEIKGIMVQVVWSPGANPEFITNYTISPVKGPQSFVMLALESAIESFVDRYPNEAVLKS